MAGSYSVNVDYQSIHLLNHLLIIDPAYDTMLSSSFIEVFLLKKDMIFVVIELTTQ